MKKTTKATKTLLFILSLSLITISFITHRASAQDYSPKIYIDNCYDMQFIDHRRAKDYFFATGLDCSEARFLKRAAIRANIDKTTCTYKINEIKTKKPSIRDVTPNNLVFNITLDSPGIGLEKDWEIFVEGRLVGTYKTYRGSGPFESRIDLSRFFDASLLTQESINTLRLIARVTDHSAQCNQELIIPFAEPDLSLLPSAHEALRLRQAANYNPSQINKTRLFKMYLIGDSKNAALSVVNNLVGTVESLAQFLANFLTF